MDQLLLNLSYGLGLQQTIGWFLPIFLGTVNVLSSLLAIFRYADKSAEYNRQNKDLKELEGHVLYDFIIVGGGTSGSIVANRLSQHYKVLLLDRGGEPHPLTAVPGLDLKLRSHLESAQAYLTEPQNESCLSLINKQSLWSQGTGLGGSSTINSMTYMRGHPYDYDIWAYWTKDKRWNYESVLAYFLKSENYCFKCDSGRGRNPTHPAFHGSEGELHLQKPDKTNLANIFIHAMEWAGIPRADLNAPFIRGVDLPTYTQHFGRRLSTRDVFLNPIRNRENLKIVKYARVYKVLFDGDRAYGVEYEQFGKVKHAGVTKEVILSAGTIDTPKILLLSGIGPEQHLKQLEIPVIYNSPQIGENLQDHVGTILPFIISQPDLHENIDLKAAQEFIDNGTGPLSFPSSHAAFSILPSSQAEFVVYPDIQITLSPPTVITPMTISTLSKIYNINENVLTQFYSAHLKQEKSTNAIFNLLVNYARPRSRGSIKLKSNNFRDDPIIDPNYFSVKQDLEILVEGLKIGYEIGESAPSFKKLKAQLNPTPWPKCSGILFKSDEYFKCLAKEFTLTSHHFVGTVRMGDEPISPLDSELRVRGVHGLRVVDASVMPFITSMDTMGAVIMIAERGSGFILEQWEENSNNTNYDKHQGQFGGVVEEEIINLVGDEGSGGGEGEAAKGNINHIVTHNYYHVVKKRNITDS